MWRHVSNSCLVQQVRERRYTFITVVSLGVILLAFFLAYAAFASEPGPLPTLKLIHVVFRHGSRTPTSSYPTDPHKDYIWPEGRGELTNRGKAELYAVGKTMRNRYKDFLSNLYHPDEIYMESSYAPRCQMSAMTFLAGVFPPIVPQVWNPDLLWQPIPVNPIPRSIDNKIAAKAKCPKFDAEKKKSDQQLHESLSKHNQKIFEYLGQHTGVFVTNVSQAESIYYILMTQSENKLALPDWAGKVFPEQLALLAGINLASFTRTDLLKKLQAGPMLKEWVSHIKDHSKESKKKAYFYSGHDLTLVSLMRTLGFDNLDLPEYGATLVIEYHETDTAQNDGFIQVYYFKNSQEPKPFQMKLPFCEPDCPIASFIDGLWKYIPEDWESECQQR